MGFMNTMGCHCDDCYIAERMMLSNQLTLSELKGIYRVGSIHERSGRKSPASLKKQDAMSWRGSNGREWQAASWS